MPLENYYPTKLVSGDSLAFYVPSRDYPPSAGWDLKYVILTPTPTIKEATTFDDNTFKLDFAPTDTESISPGIYGSSRVFGNVALSQRQSESGSFILVKPNPLLPLAVTWARQTLQKVNEALAKSGAGNFQFSINGQSFTKHNISSLLAFRDRLLFEVGIEDAAAGRPSTGGSKTIRTIFRS